MKIKYISWFCKQIICEVLFNVTHFDNKKYAEGILNLKKQVEV